MAAPSGTTWGSIVGGYGRIGIYTSVSSSATTTTVSVQVWFWSKYTVSDSSNKYYFDTASSATTSRGSVSIKTTVASGSGWSSTNQVKIGSSAFTYSRGTSAQTKYFAAKLSGIDRVGGTMYCSKSISVPAKASYKITYNANGGTGAPGAQTKWYGTDLKLSSGKPSRTGYTFQGWSITGASGSVYYQPGATCGRNENLTLYAIWKANTYSVTYNANGGSGAPGAQTKTYGVNLTLSGTKPTRTNYNFLGWGTSAASTTVAYAAGATYTSNAAITLYAIWELAYLAPRIVNCTVDRCDANGTLSEEGTYAIVKCDWATDKPVTGIKIGYKAELDTAWAEVAVTATGTSGTISKVIGSSLSTEFSYDIKITVSDSIGSSGHTKTIAPMTFTIDFLKGGRGVAFGKPASLEGVVDIGFKSRFTGGIDAIEIEANTDLNSITTPGYYVCRDNATAATLLNSPTVKAFSLEVYSHAGIHQRLTIYLSYDVHTYVRNYYGNVWGGWQNFINTEELETDTDLNNVVIPGIYYSQGSNPNAPEFIINKKYSFTLEVYQAGSIGQLLQRITACNKDRTTVYQREFFSNAWGDWNVLSLSKKSHILWQGAFYMQSGQIAKLSEKITDQANGVVFVFSRFDGSTAKNEQFTSHFVPKEKVALHNGTGHGFLLTCGFQEGVRYVYINDVEIGGHAMNNNGSYNPANNTIYSNNKFVLRYIIGV